MVESKNNKNTLFCSFCGKSQHEVRKLIAGPTVFICDECVELCMDIIREENKVISSPKSGHVEGVIDLSGLKNKVKQIESLNVLNGIAYNSISKTFFVTGKNWNKIFEVEFFQK